MVFSGFDPATFEWARGVSNDWLHTDLRPEERSLEDLFLELTGAAEAIRMNEEACA